MDSIRTLLEARTSANHFDAKRPLEEAQIVEPVRLATQSPSAYNFQNWRSGPWASVTLLQCVAAKCQR